MSMYSKEQIARAEQTDLGTYLLQKGYDLKKSAGGYRLESEGLSIKGNCWYSYYKGKGGRTISFLTEFEGLSFPEAVKALIGEEGNLSRELVKIDPPEHLNEQELLLPEPHENSNALYAYFRARGIDPKITRDLIESGLVYQSNMYWSKAEDGTYEKRSCAPEAVFLGFDPEGKRRYACSRSCSGEGKYEIPGSDKAYAFALPDGDSKSVWVFESAIDLLSHATLCSFHKEDTPVHRISLGGVSPAALEQYLSDHPDIRYVNLALDRDKTGREAAEAIKQRLSGKRRIYDHVPRYGKDINDDLMEVRRRYRERTQQRDARRQETAR